MGFFKCIVAFAGLLNLALFVYESHMLSANIRHREAQFLNDIDSLKREHYLGFVWPNARPGVIPTPQNTIESLFAGSFSMLLFILSLASLPTIAFLNSMIFVPRLFVRRPYGHYPMYLW